MSEQIRRLAHKASAGFINLTGYRNITPPPPIGLTTSSPQSPPNLISDSSGPFSSKTAPPKSPSLPAALAPFARVEDQVSLEISPTNCNRQIVGADLSIPVFDGRTDIYAEHLIDLDTPSMETVLDVRLYFWTVGDSLQDPEASITHTMEQAKIYDDAVVRAGRLYLKDCRARGHGYFLNNTRHLAWFNQPGNPWYRMPTFGIVNDLIEGRLLGEPGEGFFENLWVKRVEQGRMDADGLMLTNIRMPVLWADFENDTFRRGSADYNYRIMAMYTDLNPLARLLWEYGRDGVMDRFFFGSRAYTDREGREAYIAREWPDDGADHEVFEPRDMLKLTGGSAKEFVTGKRPFLSRMKDLSQSFRQKN